MWRLNEHVGKGNSGYVIAYEGLVLGKEYNERYDFGFCNVL